MTTLTNEQLTELVIELNQRVKELEGKKKTSRFTPPEVSEVINYMNERGHYQSIDEAEKFCDFYQSKGWLVGKTKMKDWKASVRQWLKRQQTNQPSLPMIQNQPVTQKQVVRTSLRNINNTDW